jgi:hypothetical protein
MPSIALSTFSADGLKIEFLARLTANAPAAAGVMEKSHLVASVVTSRYFCQRVCHATSGVIPSTNPTTTSGSSLSEYSSLERSSRKHGNDTFAAGWLKPPFVFCAAHVSSKIIRLLDRVSKQVSSFCKRFSISSFDIWKRVLVL